MKTFYIIRHAESLANKGERTERHDTIPLTDAGKQQAINLVDAIEITPHLIVVSPFTRTAETAKPFVQKFSDVPVETWEVEEFTYLNPDNFNGTTREERKEAVSLYWNRGDIYYRDADNVESYLTFFHRIERFLQKISARKEENIIVFSHGNFIYALKEYLLLKEKGFSVEDAAKEVIMSQKNIRHEEFPIKNASVHRICI